jgi:hypothetical protein
MKKTLRGRPRRPSPLSEATPPEGAQPTPAAKFTPRGSNKKRLLVAVEDNKIDFSSMSAETSKQVNELFHNPECQAQFGIGPMHERFDPRHCKRIYEAAGLVLVSFARLAMKWPESACELLIYTEDEKAELADPTAKALDELAPAWLREHQALAALVLVFGAMTQGKLRAAAMEARRVIIERQRQGAAPASAAPVGVPQPTNGGARVVIPMTGRPGGGMANGGADAGSQQSGSLPQ